MLRGHRQRLLSHREQGFTMVELIVAMFVLAIVIISIIGIQAAALVTNADSNARQQATAYANEAVEQMRAIPWNVLRKGMAANYIAASGGDPFVAGGVLNVEGTSVALRIANAGSPTGGAQDLSAPWPPLFDHTGSHTHVVQDSSGRGTEFTIRAYVTEDQGGQSEAMGLAAVVTWDSIDSGEEQVTVIFSTAYAPSGGCGDKDAAPFLAACQAQFYGQANSGNVVMTASATTVGAPNGADPQAVPTSLFSSSPFYQLQMSTGATSANLSSQQFTTVRALGHYGGVRWDDDDGNTQPEVEGWVTGFESYALESSDDNVTPDAPSPNPADVAMSGSNSSHTISGPGAMSLVARSDDSRTGMLDASTVSACSIGVGAATVPAGQPCASGPLGPSTMNSGYMSLALPGASLQLGRVLHETGSSRDSAWVGRYLVGLSGSSETGCTVLSGAGCASSGAVRSIGNVNVGTLNGSSWDDGDAPMGLVTIADYSDRVRVERGEAQASTVPLTTRQGTVRFWTDSGYRTEGINPNTNAVWEIEPVTWSSGSTTVTATGQISVSPWSSSTEGIDPLCKVEACSISSTVGSVRINIQYTIEAPGQEPFILGVTTQVNGSTAAVSYKEPEDA